MDSMDSLDSPDTEKNALSEKTNLIEYLEKNCDLTKDKLDQFKKDLSEDQYEKLLIQNCKIPEIRNSMKPYGEIYIPVIYTDNYIIKYVQKAGWNGYLLVLVTWDLLIIDIDIPLLVEDIIELLEYYYPDELFYIHKTNKGFHAFLMSKSVNNSTKESIKMKISLICDPAHGSNTVYTGNSIRLCLKDNDNLDIASKFLCSCGKGIVNENMRLIYNDIIKYLDMFKCVTVTNIENNKEILNFIKTENNKILTKDLLDMGAHQINICSPAHLDDNLVFTISKDSSECSSECSSESSGDIEIVERMYKYMKSYLWTRFVKSRVLQEKYVKFLLSKGRENMGYNNLYRIFESNIDYAYGCHIQENLYFIVYRDLLVVDYDKKNQIQILATFCRYHPEYLFKVVRTPAGYHCFLVSHKIPFTNTSECYSMLNRLRSDPMHIVSSLLRGYSIRVNQKHRYEKPYIEMKDMGRGNALPELLLLYKVHMLKYISFVENKGGLYQIQKTITRDMVSL